VKLGPEIRRRRRALGLTIEALAERAGLTPNYLGTLEMGRRDPSLSTVVGLARALGVSLGDLLGGSAPVSAPALEAARLFEGVPPEMQEAVLRVLRAGQRRRR